ncbi:MAG: ABC transporter ATP-binding protein [Ruminococcaceae bacterium]|jgi:oligopeptide/dipeptide ABC transporter ATP-binding protein|nr:ABC transporter ATP-binding protein [Anaerolineaceae bacterium]NLM76999.1 ABC transporter ATP-binding protein [Oscillospiraceae bacterium]
MQNKTEENLLVVENLTMEFASPRRFLEKQKPSVRAVNDISFTVKEGETFGLVGESGCGKTTLGKCIIRLLKPANGKIFFNADGEMKDLLTLDHEDSFKFRKKLQIVFQDPYAALNPQHTIMEAFDEPMRIHGIGGGDKEKRKELIAMSLERVNLQPDYMYRYPHEFSGGQRQRICVAKALVLEPKLIVCDEPVSALDVSIQAQLLNLMRKLQKELGLTFIFIAHDLSVVHYMSDRIGVMYLGNMVELAEADALYSHTMHPYTEALLSAIPVPVYQGKHDRIILEGDVPSPMYPPSGCPFHPRCSRCMAVCKQSKPRLEEKANGHFVACHLFDEE